MARKASVKGSIFAISSQVVSGQVGLQAMMPPLRALGHETITLPTTLLAAHPAAFPAHGAPPGGPVPPEQMVEMADWLIAAGALDHCQAVLTGYLPTPPHVEAAATIVKNLKNHTPHIIYCCDPICGDDGRLYLPERVMQAIRDRLLPLADLATPNMFELGQLAGIERFATDGEIVAAARHLPPAHVVVTSAPAPEGRIAALAIDAQVFRCETERAPVAPHGMGDFFAALYLALSLADEPKALGIACATLGQMAGQMAASGRKTETLPHGPVQLAPAALQNKVHFA